MAITSTALNVYDRVRASRPGSPRLSYTAIEATNRTVEISGNNQNGSSYRLCPTHAWPATITRAAANTGRRDSGSVLHFHWGSAAMRSSLDSVAATLRHATCGSGRLQRRGLGGSAYSE